MKPILAYPSWHDIEKGCALIVNQSLKANRTYGAIVGLTRGGLIPAVIISHILNVPVIPVSYSSKGGRGDGSYVNELPQIRWGEDIHPALLVVDDICDSGNTMIEVCHHYKTTGHIVSSAALYYKESSLIRPDFYWQELPNDAPWITYPWET